MNRIFWPANWPHEAPETPLTIDEAHAVLRGHVNCTADMCERKRAACETLSSTGNLSTYAAPE